MYKPARASLRRLTVSRADDLGLAAMAGSESFAGLRMLNLSPVGVTDEGVERLAQLTVLESLDLGEFRWRRSTDASICRMTRLGKHP